MGLMFVFKLQKKPLVIVKRQSLHAKDNAIYDQFTKQQVIWTHGYGATDRYVTRNEWGALLLQWPVPNKLKMQRLFAMKLGCHW